MNGFARHSIFLHQSLCTHQMLTIKKKDLSKVETSEHLNLAPSPRPLTPTIWLDAPFHSKLELTPMPKSDSNNHNPSLQSKSSDTNDNLNENTANNIDPLI